MSGSHRKLKLRLHSTNPKCHWCKRVTKLNCPLNDPLMATIDHIISRYNLARWRTKKPKEVRKVLSCYECNQNRSIRETLSLSRAEILNRSRGFSLSPRGKPTIKKTLPTLKEVKKVLTKVLKDA